MKEHKVDCPFSVYPQAEEEIDKDLKGCMFCYSSSLSKAMQSAGAMNYIIESLCGSLEILYEESFKRNVMKEEDRAPLIPDVSMLYLFDEKETACFDAILETYMPILDQILLLNFKWNALRYVRGARENHKRSPLSKKYGNKKFNIPIREDSSGKS